MLYLVVDDAKAWFDVAQTVKSEGGFAWFGFTRRVANPMERW